MGVVERRCSKCKETLPLDSEHFHRSSGKYDNGYQHNCKRCSREKREEWAHSNRDRDTYARKLLRAGMSIKDEREAA